MQENKRLSLLNQKKEQLLVLEQIAKIWGDQVEDGRDMKSRENDHTIIQEILPNSAFKEQLTNCRIASSG
jgi:hypothetical protein